MIKFTDVHNIIQKKITRNNNLYDIFNLYQKIIDKEIIIRQLMNDHYDKQKNIICQINEIERFQCNEYTTERQEEIIELTKKIGINNSNVRLKDINNDINNLKKDIVNNINIINHIQSLIPKEGVATNYKIIENSI